MMVFINGSMFLSMPLFLCAVVSAQRAGDPIPDNHPGLQLFEIDSDTMKLLAKDGVKFLKLCGEISDDLSKALAGDFSDLGKPQYFMVFLQDINTIASVNDGELVKKIKPKFRRLFELAQNGQLRQQIKTADDVRNFLLSSPTPSSNSSAPPSPAPVPRSSAYFQNCSHMSTLAFVLGSYLVFRYTHMEVL